MSTGPLEKAIEIVGSQTALAIACGIKQPHIWNWLNRDKRVPAEYVIPICKATDFKVTPHEMRPDIYPNKTDGMPPGKPKARRRTGGAKVQTEECQKAAA